MCYSAGFTLSHLFPPFSHTRIHSIAMNQLPSVPSSSPPKQEVSTEVSTKIVKNLRMFFFTIIIYNLTIYNLQFLIRLIRKIRCSSYFQAALAALFAEVLACFFCGEEGKHLAFLSVGSTKSQFVDAIYHSIRD